ncbi:sigma factor-like helix-turn-helix DNA-binding protein [Nonomuraea sp. NPDC050547]
MEGHRTLSPRQRAVIVLHYFEGRTLTQVADILAARWARSKASSAGP